MLLHIPIMLFNIPIFLNTVNNLQHVIQSSFNLPPLSSCCLHSKYILIFKIHHNLLHFPLPILQFNLLHVLLTPFTFYTILNSLNPSQGRLPSLNFFLSLFQFSLELPICCRERNSLYTQLKSIISKKMFVFMCFLY